MASIVLKYGGTSVGTPARIRAVAEQVAALKSAGHRVAVVVSAMGHATDHLVELMGQVAEDPPGRELDMLLASGEQVSIALVAAALERLGVTARSLLGFQAGVVTAPDHTRAAIARVDTSRMKGLMAEGVVPVVAGFQGMTEAGEVTTLGRGGSDTTAVALAVALGVDRCEICTDVDGVYTTDPRVVPEARLLPEVAYEEMLELASLGAKVLHPRSVELAARSDMVLVVRSSFGKHPGTIVRGVDQLEIHHPVTGVTVDLDQVRVVLRGLPDRPDVPPALFAMLAEQGRNVDVITMLTRSGPDGQRLDLGFTVATGDAGAVVGLVRDWVVRISGATVEVDDAVAKVSIVGAGMVHHPGVAAGFFQALEAAGIPIGMISTSEIKVSCVVPRHQGLGAVQAAHRWFALHETRQPFVLSR
ncbi:MAG: aspartate kinase [Candidatus Sericytochromatia bacterium]|nr:aspartate kinase [Candidatus Sericytochromatia bacterium]